jgi:NDP-sugar pyrophosphorylase family protein
MKPTLVILAAGMGSRYGGLKQIDSVGPSGEAIIDYSIYDAIRVGFGKIVFIIRKDIESAFRERFEGKFDDLVDIEYVFQELNSCIPDHFGTVERTKPWGTAHAMLVASGAVHTPFAIINADDYYGVQAYRIMAQFLKEQCSQKNQCMIGYSLSNTLSEHGTVSRGVCEVDENHLLTEINERTQIGYHDGLIQYRQGEELVNVDPSSFVSMNFWGFHPTIFPSLYHSFQKFAEENKENSTAEFFIPLFVQEMMNKGLIRMQVIPCPDQWYGITYREDKSAVTEVFHKMVDEGIYPRQLWPNS